MTANSRMRWAPRAVKAVAASVVAVMTGKWRRSGERSISSSTTLDRHESG